MSDVGVPGSLMLLFIGLVLYFLPTINAKSRKHPNRSSIFLLNLFLGWTLIGWVVAVVWSSTAIKPAQTVQAGEELMDKSATYQAIEKLASLKDRGLITEAEYDLEKSKLLSS
ncbi:superinfection immunity protein [Pseudomonas syringae]|uniref:superinfection immunity protein n=1 Tax=Pseudomonas syringae TaxID=317 RepID=UPI0006478107|nr:superinfection immunity protein [Pseudomonas syringae]